VAQRQPRLSLAGPTCQGALFSPIPRRLGFAPTRHAHRRDSWSLLLPPSPTVLTCLSVFLACHTRSFWRPLLHSHAAACQGALSRLSLPHASFGQCDGSTTSSARTSRFRTNPPLTSVPGCSCRRSHPLHVALACYAHCPLAASRGAATLHVNHQPDRLLCAPRAAPI
jgi:hypothetical protein